MGAEPFVECPVDEFIAHYLPFNPDDAKVDVVGTDDATCAPNTANAALSDMVALPPPSWQQHSSSTGALERATVSRLTTDRYNEATAYRSYVQDIVDAIGDMKVAGRTRKDFRYRATVKSEVTQGFSNEVDGCIVSASCVTPTSELDIRTTGVAVVFAFGLEEMGDDEIENNKKVVRANIQIMNEDARRMWTYGVTVFGKMVRLWYHDRSHSAVSELFDFVENPKLLINVIISFLFATELELGYDPKITRMPDNRLVFEIADDKNKSKPRFHRTVRTLSAYHSNCIAGRACRVWEVEQAPNADGTGDVLSRGVLKDVWVDEGTLAEREVQDAIFKAIEDRKANVDSHKGMKQVMGSAKLLELVNSGEYKKFFLTIVADCVGLSSKTVAPGARRRLGLLCPEMDSYSRTSGDTPQWKVKRQSRTISAELCVTVGRMETMGQVLDVLSQALTALRIMYFAGWVHRDISSGNVMAYRSGSKGDGTPTWQTKLCDLEYAKEYTVDSPVTSEDPKIGTPFFMAAEIMWGKALLPPEPAKRDQTTLAPAVPLSLKDEEIETRARIKAEREARMARLRLAAQRPTEQCTEVNVIPNFQHDLESIWWLTLYSATARADHPPSKNFAAKIFQHTTQLSMDRAACLTEPIKSKLDRCLHPDLLDIVSTLETLRKALLSEYHKRNAARLQNGAWDDTESFADIINRFYIWFDDLLLAASLDAKLANFPLIHETKKVDIPVAASTQSKKRARSIRDDDEYRDEFEDGREERYADDAKLKKKGGAKRAKNTGKD